VSDSTDTNPDKLRNMAAVLATLSGAAQCLSLWLLPVTPTLLLTALTGSLYLLLALGLFGISRFTLMLAITLPLLRSWFGLYPLDIPAWELLRVACDIAIAALSVPVLWASLDPDYRPPPQPQQAPDDGGAPYA
jgi:hypothetical protein